MYCYYNIVCNYPSPLNSLAPDDYIATSTRITISGAFGRFGRFCANIILVDDNLHDSIFGSMFFRVSLESNDPAVNFFFPSRVSVFISENDG